MAKAKVYTVKLKRKLLGKTDYSKRLKLLSANKPRMVVRKSLNHILAQVVEYGPKGDRILESAHSDELRKLGWKCPTGNVPSAYLVGLLLGKKLKDKGINDIILDLGLQRSVKGSRVYAVLKGVLEKGIRVPHDENVLPGKDRVEGKHIADYALNVKKDSQRFERFFGRYIKSNADPTKIEVFVNQLKSTIAGGKNER